MLDIDDSSEVNAAAGKFTGALDTVAGQVTETVRNLHPHSRPESPLDTALESVRRRWINTPINNALAANNGRAEATYHRTVHTTNVLDAQDIAGGSQVRRESD